MERRVEHELEALKVSLIRMGSVVEESFGMSIHAALGNDEATARKVIEMDDRINSLELEIDNAILDLLALQQPVAGDLRFIIAVQKINNDLERIGDHAVNIAESALAIQKLTDQVTLSEIPRMAEMTQSMLKQVLDSFVQIDPRKAQEVLRTDDEVDDLNRLIARRVIERVKSDVHGIECGLELIRISRNLERVADLTTNIAEEVLFYAQARVVKHHAEEKKDTHHEDYGIR